MLDYHGCKRVIISFIQSFGNTETKKWNVNIRVNYISRIVNGVINMLPVCRTGKHLVVEFT